jgi:hypothetical protein
MSEKRDDAYNAHAENVHKEPLSLRDPAIVARKLAKDD